MALSGDQRQQLRTGQAVQLKSGLYGRLNAQKRALELSSGETLPIDAEDVPYLLPENSLQTSAAQERESIQRQIEATPFGEFLFKAGEHSGTAQFFKGLADNFISRPYEAIGTKSGQENLSYFERLGENRAAQLAAYQDTSKQISEENPFSTGLGAVTGIGADLFATKGIGPGKAAAGLTVLGQPERLIDDPEAVLTEGAMAGALGYGVGKATDTFSKLASLRGARRGAKENIANIEASNVAGQEAQDLLNAQNKATVEQQRQAIIASNMTEKAKTDALNALNRQNVLNANQQAQQAYQSQKAANDQIIQQYKAQVAQREKDIFNLQQNHAQQKAARDAEVFRLKQEADAAKAAHSATEAEKIAQWKKAVEENKAETARLDKEFKEQMNLYEKERDLLPQLQEEANRQFSANTVQSMEKALNYAGKEGKFTPSQLAVNEFIDGVQQGARSATPAANEATKFLRGVFSKLEKGSMSTGELLNAFRTIEARIAKGSPEVKMILSEFKDHLSQRLPQAVSDSKFYTSKFATFEKNLINAVEGRIKGENGFAKAGVRNNLKEILSSLSPEQFSQMAKNGTLKTYIADSLGGGKAQQVIIDGRTFKGATVQSSELAKNVANYIENEANKIFRPLETDAFINYLDAQKSLGGKLKKITGMAEPIPEPIQPVRSATPEAPFRPEPTPEPIPPVLPGPVEPPVLPQPIPAPNLPTVQAPVPQTFIPQAPNVQAVPPKYVDQPFIPQNVPQLPTPQGGMEKLAAGLEDFRAGDLLKSKSATDNPLAKLALLKYTFGKAAGPLEATAALGIGGLKALTSPGVGGQITRESFKQGMLGIIDEQARKYPSYRNGILDSPQDRRSLVKEIEENPTMSLEDKAIYQSRINRGEPLAKQ